MGKASNRKKHRKDGTGPSRADLEARRALEQVARAAQDLSRIFRARREHRALLARSWRGGAEPETTPVPTWAEDSAGDRFFGASWIADYAAAPRLATARIPSADAFAADSGHWNVAVAALVRAVVLDRVPITDPGVTTVVRLLGSAVDAEIEHAASRGREHRTIGDVEEGLPVDDGPVFLLGACCLIDATWAVVGLDPLRDVPDRLTPRLDAALTQLNVTPKPGGRHLPSRSCERRATTTVSTKTGRTPRPCSRSAEGPRATRSSC